MKDDLAKRPELALVQGAVRLLDLPELKEELVKGFKAAGKRLDMGQSCGRFKKIDDLPLDVIGRAIAATPMKPTWSSTRASSEEEEVTI